MNVQLVGGPDDGSVVDVPVPLAAELTIIVVQSDEEREYLEALDIMFGATVLAASAVNYLRDEYRLAARANTEPIYVFRREVPHGMSR